MTEYDDADYCPECENIQVFNYSGSGRKRVCDGCLSVSVRTVGKSFKRCETNFDEWNFEGE